MTTAVDSLPALAEQLVQRQNPDGGWGYTNKSSWTEPTSLAVLALSTIGAYSHENARGRDWIRQHQRDDGGWPPQPGVDQSTWVTASVLLVPEIGGYVQQEKALDWVLNTIGRESSMALRVLRAVLRKPQEFGEGTTGWPWFPDTAAWVTPTVFSILALQKVGKQQDRAVARIEEGRRFLLARICSDGGWNHGAARALHRDATSYPDTTGQALIALHGIADSRLTTAAAYAEKQLCVLRSAEEASWLQLGLAAQGFKPVDLDTKLVCRATNAIALRILAIAAKEKHAFL